jgi:hypothetical protein
MNNSFYATYSAEKLLLLPSSTVASTFHFMPLTAVKRPERFILYWKFFYIQTNQGKWILLKTLYFARNIFFSLTQEPNAGQSHLIREVSSLQKMALHSR